MKVIFLDIDGVLNCAKTTTLRRWRQEHGESLGEFYEVQMMLGEKILSDPTEPLHEKYNKYGLGNTIVLDIDEEKVKILGEIIKQTGAKVVLSSSLRWDWKNGADKLRTRQHRALKFLFDKYEIEVVGITPEVSGGNKNLTSSSWRENEIKAYLSKHSEIDSFCVIDDDIEDLMTLKDYMVQTSYGTDVWDDGGLQNEHIEQVISILNKNLEKEKF